RRSKEVAGGIDGKLRDRTKAVRTVLNAAEAVDHRIVVVRAGGGKLEHRTSIFRAAQVGDTEDVAGGVEGQSAERHGPVVAGKRRAEIVKRGRPAFSAIPNKCVDRAAVLRASEAGGSVER